MWRSTHTTGVLPWIGVGSKRDRLGCPAGRAGLYVSKQWGCVGFCLGMDKPAKYFGLGGRSAWVILSATGCLIRRSSRCSLKTPVSNFMFTIPGPHRRLEPPRCLLEKQHS